MKTNLFSLIIVFISVQLYLYTNSVFSQWEQMRGPNGGDIQCFTYSGSDLFVGSWDSGVLLTTDNGLTWKKRNNGLENQTINALIINGNNIFAGAYGGVFKSTNKGNNWSACGLLIHTVYALSISGNNIFAGTSAGVFISTNNGNDWNAVNNGLENTNIRCLAVSGNRIYAGSLLGGLFLTTNNGLEWSECGLINHGIKSVAESGTYTYALSTQAGLMSSEINSNNWSVITNGLVVNSLRFVTVNGSKIFCGTTNGLFASTNNGQNWVSVGFQNKYTRCLIPKNNDYFVGTDNFGVYISTNGGNNWSQCGLPNQTASSIFSKDNLLFAGTINGVSVSIDNGYTWTITSLNNSTTSFAQIGNNICAGGNDGVFISSDNGVSWLQTAYTNQVNALSVIGNNIYAGSPVYGVLISVNNGQSWSYTSLTGKHIKSLCVSGNIIFAGTDQIGVYRSTDYGASWNNSALNNKTIPSLAAEDNVIIAGSQNNGVYLSTNYGLTYLQTSLNNKNVLSLAVQGTNIFAGTDTNGVYLSTNNGVTWIQKNQGFEVLPPVTELFIRNNYIFAGTYGQSVWRRSLTEIIRIENISTEIPGTYSLEQNYPNPFNPTTKIAFSIPGSLSRLHREMGWLRNADGVGLVVLKIFDITGREVQTLVNESLQPGTYEVSFDGSGLNSGVYFYKLTTGDYSETKKMVLVK